MRGHREPMAEWCRGQRIYCAWMMPCVLYVVYLGSIVFPSCVVYVMWSGVGMDT